MSLLILFAFLAGIATIFAPCILPILPIVLSAGVTGGKRRPLGIVVGLVASFTFFTLALSYLTRSFGLDPSLLRQIAIVILFLFGVLLLIPKLLTAFEVMVSRILPQAKTDTTKRNDFLGGIIIGISLGLVWTPCVGPIVASVITLAATSSVSALSILIIAAYALGTSIPLLLIIYGGQSLIKKARSLSRIAPQLQKVFGGIMIVTSVAMFFGFDRILQSELLSKLPSSLSTGITQQLEESDLVQNQLRDLQGVTSAPVSSSLPLVSGVPSGLSILGKAADFVGISHWLNSTPLTLGDLRGKVVLIDFWTYSCINCIRTLTHVTSWYDTYRDQGLVVIGVHTPEFAFEKNTANVEQAIKQFGIHYPVAQDNDFGTWSAYNNHYWPAEYLIDSQGNLRETHFGEGDYDKTEANIRTLLMESKQSVVLPGMTTPASDINHNYSQSPETYLGTDRRENYQKNIDVNSLPLNNWTLNGNWQEDAQSISSKQADVALAFRFVGQDAYLVLNPSTTAATTTVKVLLDGKPIGADAGSDVHNGIVTVDHDRLYHLVHLSTVGQGHLLTLIFQTPGTKAFAFTFG